MQMESLPKPGRAAVFVFVLALALLIPGYYGNAWHAAGKKWFIDWQKFHEHYVVARLVQSRQAGAFSYGALLGYGDITTWDVNLDVIDHEYDLFVNGGQFSAYWTYNSVPGLQALPFHVLDRYSGLAPATTLKLFRFIESTLAAVVLGLFLVWILGQFGLTAALLTLAFMASSEWLTLFGANFYWNLWAFYLPLTALCLLLERTSKTGQPRKRIIFLLLAGTLFIKCLFNGFEFISTALVMPFCALVYYHLRQRWTLQDFVSQFVSASFGALTGTATALGILALQIASVTGGWMQALEFIAHTLGKRSLGDPSQYSGIEAESLRANLFTVLQTYLNGRALSLNSIFQVKQPDLEFHFWQLFALFALATLSFFLRERFMGGFPQQKTAYALLAATWFSALAPLSWFVLFRAHSYIHTQINFIIWQMPFTLFGFAMCGFILSNIFQKNPVNKKTA
jgi:hypothetical protein